MSVFELEVTGLGGTAPFASAAVLPDPVGARPGPALVGVLDAPFAESLEHDLAAEVDAAALLRAELADESFDEALQALADEAAVRQLRATGTWHHESEIPELGTGEAELWLESLAAQSDRVLGALENYFADRSVESLLDGEVEVVSGYGGWELEPFTSPADAQEQFFRSLLDKAKKVARGVAKIAAKGVAAVGKFLPLGRVFALLRRLVRPLLRRVLRSAIGRLPASLRPLATQLAARFAGASATPTPPASGSAPPAPQAVDPPDAAPMEPAATEPGGAGQDAGETFDRLVSELLLAPNDTAVERGLTELEADPATSRPADDPQLGLDVARARLARELATAPAGEAPTAQLQQFIPAVMAAMPLIRTGVRIAGRQRVVGVVAAAIAQLIRGMVGQQAATQLSRHIADAGLRLLGLEAEQSSDTLGAEALAAAAEDTVREVLSMSHKAFGDDRLLTAEVQRAFTEAAARHLPAAVLRPEVVERESGGEHAFWLMMPRATRPCFRYAKYGRMIPVEITRPAARALVMSGGETLEHHLLDDGQMSWPVAAEVEVYELFDGSTMGHLAAFESEDGDEVADATAEFEELNETAAALLTGNPRLAAVRSGVAGRGRRRYYRLRVGGRALYRRRRVLSLRLDLSAARPVLTVQVYVGEREAHELAGHLESGRMPQVLGVLRGLLGAAMRHVMARRLLRMLGRRGIPVLPDAADRLSRRLAEAMLQAVSQQLPVAATSLSQAAKDAAPGLTLSFAFSFPDARSIGSSDPQPPTLSVRPGGLRG